MAAPGVRTAMLAPPFGEFATICGVGQDCVKCTWWALGRDTTREVDAATGAVTGPYEAPQVITCVVVLVGLVVVGVLALVGGTVVTAVTRGLVRNRS